MSLEGIRGIPERLLALRGERSQREFARDLGIFQQNLSRYERGLSVPHAEILAVLARHDGISLDWLVLGKGPRRRGSRP